MIHDSRRDAIRANSARGDAVAVDGVCMVLLKVVQWLLGFVVIFYLYKALLGKMCDGDGLKFAVASLIWVTTMLFTSGLIEIK